MHTQVMHAIEQTQLRGRRRVDGVVVFHTGRHEEESAFELRGNGHEAESGAIERLRGQPAPDAFFPALQRPGRDTRYVDGVVGRRAHLAAECHHGEECAFHYSLLSDPKELSDLKER